MHSKRSQRGIVEDISGRTIIGWADDPMRGGKPASLFLFIDDKPVTNFFCEEPRQDVLDSGGVTLLSGFKVEIPVEFADGATHSLCVRFDNGAFVSIKDESGRVGTNASFAFELKESFASCVDGLVNGAIRGWVYVQQKEGELKHGRVTLRALCDGTDLGLVKADQYRPDVASVLGCDPNCGIIFVPPPRYRTGKPHRIEFQVQPSGQPLGEPVEFTYPPLVSETRLARIYDAVEGIGTQVWRLKRELKDVLSQAVLTLQDYDVWARQYQAALRFRQRRSPWPSDRVQPLVSVLCPVYRPQLGDFKAAVDSVLAQSYQNWELILVDDNGQLPEVTAMIEEYLRRDSRVRALPQAVNVGISGATNVAISAARGDYIAFFDHDDLLEPVAVELMMGVAVESGAKVLYSDEDKIDDFGRFSDPNLKSAWNYRLALGQNYVCHFLVLRADVLRATGSLRKKYDGAQDHDLVLRLSEMVRSDEIVHVAEVIYHWRKTPGSTATRISAKSYAVKAGSLAITDHLKRRGIKAKAASMLGMTVYDLTWVVADEPSVTIVIPFREQAEITARCVERLVTNTEYTNYKVILIDNWSTSKESKFLLEKIAKHNNISVLRVEEPFNYSKLNNLACQQLNQDYFVFMNNDVFVEQADWLRKLVNEAVVDPDVGAVGAKLVYPNRTVQHGGVVLGVGGIGDHAYRGLAPEDPFYMGRGICAQEVSAVTAALMLCRAAAFEAVGGFDQENLAVAYNDVDLCLKLRQAGYRIIFCPAIIAEHHESISRGSDMSDANIGRFVEEEQVMLTRWGTAISEDACYNPNFSNDGGIYRELSMKPLRLTPQAVRYRVASVPLSLRQ